MNTSQKHRQGGGKQLHDSLFGLPLAPEQPSLSNRRNSASSNLAQSTFALGMSFSVTQAHERLTHTSEETWLQRGAQRSLALFHAAAQSVPAYKDFLAKHGIRPASIRSLDDFRQLPIIDKENYLRAYPLEACCWYGDLPSSHIVSVSSGSSGKPFFWPRGLILETETALEHELFLASFFELDRYSTLFIICFAMGMYVAGPITMNSVLRLGTKGYPVTVVTPGYSPDDVLSIIPDLAPKYDQIVLAGYPPYIKEIIDQGIESGIEWGDFRLRFLLAGEGFNESWRTYVAQLAGNQSPLTDFINLYGSADAAVLAHETVATVVVRRRVAEDTAARKKLFGNDRLPSLLQYYPEHKYFEEVGGELIFTAPGGIPLVRYNIHDSGGILTRQHIIDAIPQLNEYFTELEQHSRLWNLPFVYVFGKSDQTVIVYGANVYPENIRRALEDETIRHRVTGKVVMHIELDHNKDQRLHIDVECSAGTRITKYLASAIRHHIVETLLTENSEYRVVHKAVGERTVPIIKLYPYGDKHFHIPRIKHTWTR